MVESLPEPRRTEIRARFADARRRLHSAGLLESLQDAEHWTEEDYKLLVGTYFQQGIPCPFLQGGSCSIYEERPITCREYLVTSPEHMIERVVPLILAPEWAEAHPDEPPPRPGPDLLRELLGHLSEERETSDH